VFVIGQNGPTIFVDLKNMQGCNIYGLRIANRGFSKVKFREDFQNMIDVRRDPHLSPSSHKYSRLGQLSHKTEFSETE
jgi:hypothetical protein